MPWYAVDDEFPEHPKLEKLESDYVLHSLCVACWTLLGADCARRRTGGFVSKARLAKVLAFWPAKAREKAVAALVEPLKLWEVAVDGWQFHDWDDYQPSAEELAEEKNLKTERQRRWRQGQREAKLQRLRVDAAPSTAPSTRVDGQASTLTSTKTSAVDSGARAPRVQARARALPLPNPLPPPQSPSPLAALGSECARGDLPDSFGVGPLAGSLTTLLDGLSKPAAYRDAALDAAETLVRVEFVKRFEAAEEGLWTRSGDPAVATLARWALSVPGGPDAAVKRLLDNFFADEWCRSRHFDIAHLARHVQKYFDPRKAPATAARFNPDERLAELRARLGVLEGDLANANMGSAEPDRIKKLIADLRREMRLLKGAE
jgi:hypothetical protein